MGKTTRQEEPYRMSIEQYEAMVNSGILTKHGGIPVYWIINIPDCQLEVFSSSVNSVYSVHQILLETESVDLVIEGRILGRVGVAELLPRP